VHDDARRAEAELVAMTSCLLGSFQSDSKTRNEFLAFVRSFAH
jgi:GTP cyclohydrolase I